MSFRKSTFSTLFLAVVALTGAGSRARGADLVIAQKGQTMAKVVIAAEAGQEEKQAAADLVRCIGLMTGAEPGQLDTVSAAAVPTFVIGSLALKMEPSLQTALDKVAKKDPVIRADAIVARRVNNRVYLAGTNAESHRFAVTWLLQQWGCRWYTATQFGECIPQKDVLTIGDLDYAYAPPFEIRHYWLAWNGDNTGATDFRRHNYMTETSMVGMGHALGHYTAELAPPGGNQFNISFSEPKTAEHIAAKIEADYAAGKDISLAIEDGNYTNDSASDKALITEWDKYSLKPSLTDAMLTLYNNVGRILRQKYPQSKAKIGGMAYANVTLPPLKVKTLEPNIVMWIAPIDIDPIHDMDSPLSAPRREYKTMLEAWAKLTGGRLAIYDYDQGMLVWRDIPNPSHQSFATDVKYYRDAGILGVGTESRGATATTFLNLYLRGQLMWNPDADVNALLTEFYPKFYGPAARPMEAYWSAIYAAWKETPATEHEYPVAPAIYTPELMAKLKPLVEAAEKAVKPLEGSTGRNEQLFMERVRFTRLSFDVLSNYTAMVTAAARDADYQRSADYGNKALAAREQLTAMNPIFTTYKNIGESGPAWFPGEVQQMRELAQLTDGSKGQLVSKTPEKWWFHRDAPLPAGWTYTGPEGPKAPASPLAMQTPSAAAGWQPMRTDVYLQGQGLLAADGQSYTGHYWYQTTLDLSAAQAAGKTHLMFPGLFNEVWLYVNGEPVAHRDYKEPWWLSDYKFEWDVDLSGKLKPGKNVIALRGFNPHHFGGIFRRPFLYRPVE